MSLQSHVGSNPPARPGPFDFKYNPTRFHLVLASLPSLYILCSNALVNFPSIKKNKRSRGRERSNQMAMSNCCLNLLPPLPDSNSIPTVKSLVSNSRAEDNEKLSRRRSPKLVSRLACAIIGLEMAAIIPVSIPDVYLTHEIYISSTSNNNGKALASESVQSVSNQRGKWSDRRSCMPWNLNSFETIVPENLPRPSARRRWESVADDSHGPRLAPPVKTITVIKTRAGCFSM